MYIQYLTPVIAALRGKGITTEPCSEAEIAYLEMYYGISFPRAYREFLRVMGKGAGPFLVGTDVFFNFIPGFREGQQELAAETGYVLPEKAFTFLMHQGYVMSFFIADGTQDNPPVFTLMEEEEAYTLTETSSFVDYLLAELGVHDLK